MLHTGIAIRDIGFLMTRFFKEVSAEQLVNYFICNRNFQNKVLSPARASEAYKCGTPLNILAIQPEGMDTTEYETAYAEAAHEFGLAETLRVLTSVGVLKIC